MKTPMRELIEFIDKEQGMFKDVVVMEIKRKAKSLLPKEKWVIIEAYENGADMGYLVPSGNPNKKGEQYFNEKYNENS